MNPVFIVQTEEALSLIEGAIQALTLNNGLGEKIAELMRQDAQRQFSDGGNPHWRELKPATIKEKRRAGYPRLSRDGSIPRNMIQRGYFGPENILMRTGALLTSWTRKDDPDAVTNISDFAIEIGSSLEYAESHQEGDQSRNLPKREIRLTDAGFDAIANLITNSLSEEMN